MKREAHNPWRRLFWPLVLLATILVYGTVAFMLVEEYVFLDALFATFVTLSTVGFQIDEPFGTGGKIVAISLMILGVSLLLVTVSLAATAVADGALGERRRRRKMQQRIDEMSGHHIVCAYGRVGQAVARELEGEGVPFVVVDVREELEDRMASDGVLYIIGDTTSEESLRLAGIDRARALICAVDSDAANVYIVLAARSINPDLFIVARASESISAERLYRAGADRVVSPFVTSGRHMAAQAVRPHVLDYFELGREREPSTLLLEEIEIGVELAGSRLADVIGEASPLVIKRLGGELITSPTPEVVLQQNDVLVLMGSKEQLRPVEGG